jgi:hypothetical protein
MHMVMHIERFVSVLFFVWGVILVFFVHNNDTTPKHIGVGPIYKANLVG